MNRWHKLALAIILVLPGVCFGQTPAQFTLQVQNSGTPVYTRSSFAALDLTGGCSGTVSGGALQITCTGGATNPGGDANQIEYNIAGTSFGGFTMSGDCSIVVSTGVITCTKSNGTAFASGAFATAYTLPAATSSTLGGVKPDGTSILNTSGAISVTPTSIGLSATSPITISAPGVIACSTCNTSSATVSSVSVTTANGVSGSVATSTTTPAITLTLGAITPSSVTISSKCAANSSSGTVACGTAPSGSFSCDTSTSAGTCVIDTSAVAAGSAIWVQPDASLGSLLSVTCNTTADTGLTAPRLSARSAGSSFTINVGTFTTHPMCFSYGVN